LSALDIERMDSVVRVTLNRPEKRNAIDPATHAALSEALAGFDADPSVRMVVLTGAGSAFCAGSDLSVPIVPVPGAERPRLVGPFEAFAKPIIVAVNGTAAGGGLEIVLCCDIRIASTSARFVLSEARIGSLPGSGGTQRLPAAVGPALAAQMIMTAEPISAERALSAGLVSELCAPEALIPRAMEIAAAVAANAPLSIMAAKRALRAAVEGPIKAGLELERALFNQLAATEDRAEGRLAFRERRAPLFKGR